ncbi:MAG: CcmD family protein [Chitinophagales bacterium]
MLLLCFSLIHPSLFAQSSPAGEFFRSDLKIYVVVAVLTIIFLGIVFFLFSMERRLKKLENRK